jgi:hypothetical protein
MFLLMALGTAWITIGLLHFYYFRHLILEKNQALSMLRIIPAWVVERNPAARRWLYTQQ